MNYTPATLRQDASACDCGSSTLRLILRCADAWMEDIADRDGLAMNLVLAQAARDRTEARIEELEGRVADVVRVVEWLEAQKYAGDYTQAAYRVAAKRLRAALAKEE